MKNGDFFNKIKRLRLNVTKFHRHVFENLGFKEGTSGRTHLGFISQDVEEAMCKAGLTDLDFAGFCKRVKTITKTDSEGFKTELPDLDENGNVQYIYSLRYDEFIALNTYILQHITRKVETIEQENKNLKQRIDNIEKILF